MRYPLKNHVGNTLRVKKNSVRQI